LLSYGSSPLSIHLLPAFYLSVYSLNDAGVLVRCTIDDKYGTVPENPVFFRKINTDVDMDNWIWMLKLDLLTTKLSM
jgi:hypothetical protein